MKWVYAILIALVLPFLLATSLSALGFVLGGYELYLLFGLGVVSALLAVGVWTYGDTSVALLSVIVAMLLGEVAPESVSWIPPLGAAAVIAALIVRQRRQPPHNTEGSPAI